MVSVLRWTPRPTSFGLVGFLPFVVLVAACLVSISCATTAPEPLRPHIPVSEADYFLDPLTGYPLATPALLESEIRQGFAVLRFGGDLPSLEVKAAAWLEQDPGFHAGRVLLAQIALLKGEEDRAHELLTPVIGELPDYLPCQMLLGRVFEHFGLWPEAFEVFTRAGASSSLAADRARDLEPQALEVLLSRADDWIERGRFEEAARQLAELETWAGEGADWLQIRRALAFVEGDKERETEVLEQLEALGVVDPSIPERLADLHLEMGNIRVAIDRLEQLSVARPEDPRWQVELERAKFRWRLRRLPVRVQETASKSVLSRADLATLLYWLFPSIRHAEVTDPPIATDILDHERQEEILPVMFLRLVAVDETLHRYWPDRLATRSLALRALLRLLALSESEFSCLSPAEARALGGGSKMICRKSAQCRLIAEEAECLPQADLSGSDTQDLIRRTLDLLAAH